MKKLKLIFAGAMLTFLVTGCARGSSQLGSQVANHPTEATPTDLRQEETTGSEPITEESTEAPTKAYDPETAAQKFAASDLPDSIKNIFLSGGKFVDTQTQTETTLPDYQVYDIIYTHDEKNADIVTETYDLENQCGVAEWCSYIIADFDNDGKKELFYDFKPETKFNQGIIFHEHTDGKVYAYRHSSLRVHIGENGDVVGSAGADLSAHTLLRYSFDTERLIETKIAYAKFIDINQYIYYAEGREVDFDEFSTYFGLLSEGSLDWTEFRIAPESGENETSGK